MNKALLISEQQIIKNLVQSKIFLYSLFDNDCQQLIALRNAAEKNLTLLSSRSDISLIDSLKLNVVCATTSALTYKEFLTFARHILDKHESKINDQIRDELAKKTLDKDNLELLTSIRNNYNWFQVEVLDENMKVLDGFGYLGAVKSQVNKAVYDGMNLI